MRLEALGPRDRTDRVADGRQALPVDPLDLARTCRTPRPRAPRSCGRARPWAGRGSRPMRSRRRSRARRGPRRASRHGGDGRRPPRRRRPRPSGARARRRSRSRWPPLGRAPARPARRCPGCARGSPGAPRPPAAGRSPPRRDRRTPGSVVTRMAGESGPCSAWLSRSAATCSGSAVASARTMTSDGPAGRSIPTSPKTSSLAAVTQALPGPTIRSTGAMPDSPSPYASAPTAWAPPATMNWSTPTRPAAPARIGSIRPSGRAGLATTNEPTPATRAGTAAISSELG